MSENGENDAAYIGFAFCFAFLCCFLMFLRLKFCNPSDDNNAERRVNASTRTPDPSPDPSTVIPNNDNPHPRLGNTRTLETNAGTVFRWNNAERRVVAYTRSPDPSTVIPNTRTLETPAATVFRWNNAERRVVAYTQSGRRLEEVTEDNLGHNRSNTNNNGQNSNNLGDIEAAEPSGENTKILLESLTLTEKKKLFSFVLECKKATKRDIGIWRKKNYNSERSVYTTEAHLVEREENYPPAPSSQRQPNDSDSRQRKRKQKRKHKHSDSDSRNPNPNTTVAHLVERFENSPPAPSSQRQPNDSDSRITNLPAPPSQRKHSASFITALRKLSSKNQEISTTSSGLCCPICIEEIQVGEDVYYSKSCEQHLFHLDCIAEWLSTGATCCPCCRGVMVTPGFLRDAVGLLRQKE